MPNDKDAVFVRLHREDLRGLYHNVLYLDAVFDSLVGSLTEGEKDVNSAESQMLDKMESCINAMRFHIESRVSKDRLF